MRQEKKVVIIGGGFAGVNVAKKLLRWAPRKFAITLIDKKDYHLFTPGLFKAATSVAQPSFIFSAIAFRFKEIFKKGKIEFFEKDIKEINLKDGEVVLRRGQVLDYDYLVLASGMETDFKNISGAKQFALPLKTFEDAIKIKSQIEEVLKTKAKRDHIRVLIAGAGLTGVEVAGELTVYLDKLAKENGHPASSISVKLIEAGNKVCASSSSWIQKQTEKRLKELNIEVLLNTGIEEIKKTEVVLKNRKNELCDLLIWAAGISSSKMVENMDLSVSESLRVGRHKNVFALGDVICGLSSMDSAKKRTSVVSTRGCTAQTAIDEANYVACEILRSSKTLPPLLWRIGGAINYKPIKPRFINAMGKDFALVDWGFIKLKGRPAYWAKNIAYLDYFTCIFSWKKAFKIYKKYKSL